ARAVGCSHTTVSAIFSSPRLPTWGLLELLVEAMDGDVSTFRLLWAAASSAGESRAAPRRVGEVVVGRSGEVALIRRHAMSGAGGLLLVTGEAGIGKT